MKDVYIIILVAAATLFSVTVAEDAERTQKLISTFQIVRFPNDACVGSNARNGTCYTSAECSDKDGTSSGSCADGFGVCCTFVINTCGQSSSENITYFDAPSTVSAGSCNLYINPLNANICQLRLDFTTFIITGPSTASTTETNLWANIPSLLGANNENEASWTTNCLTDTFSISSGNPANKPPVLCGTNSGYHMYVDADKEKGNVLSFIFQLTAGPAQTDSDTRGVTTLAGRDWDITVMQYECGYINEAPPGCTQYFWSDTGAQVAGWIETYNFVGATKHLANQNQKICIRRERNICWAAFYRTNATGAFKISGKTNGDALSTQSYISEGQPCGYFCETANGEGNVADACAYDCVIIPGSFVVADVSANPAAATVDVNAIAAIVRLGIAAATNHSPAPPQLGGHGVFGGDTVVANLALATGEATEWTSFTQHVPFTVTFKSDGFEGVGAESEADNVGNSVGMKLSYDLIPCTA